MLMFVFFVTSVLSSFGHCVNNGWYWEFLWDSDAFWIAVQKEDLLKIADHNNVYKRLTDTVKCILEANLYEKSVLPDKSTVRGMLDSVAGVF